MVLRWCRGPKAIGQSTPWAGSAGNRRATPRVSKLRGSAVEPDPRRSWLGAPYTG